MNPAALSPGQDRRCRRHLTAPRSGPAEVHDVFAFPRPPSWWTGPVPNVVARADPASRCEPARPPRPDPT